MGVSCTSWCRAAAEGIQLRGLTLLSGFFHQQKQPVPQQHWGVCLCTTSLWAQEPWWPCLAVPSSSVSCPGHAGVGAGGLQTRSRVWHSPSRGSIQAVLSQGTSLQGLLCRAQHLPSVGWACTITPTHTANLLISKIHLLLFLPMGVGRCIARNFQLH